jgi:hypothetical protein
MDTSSIFAFVIADMLLVDEDSDRPEGRRREFRDFLLPMLLMSSQQTPAQSNGTTTTATGQIDLTGILILAMLQRDRRPRLQEARRD